MTFLADNELGHANRALNVKIESALALKAGASAMGNWTADDLTESGTLVKGIIDTR